MYNSIWETRIDNWLDTTTNSQILKNFNVYLSDLSSQTKYLYIQRVGDFLDCTINDPTHLTFDDYSNYINASKYKNNEETTTQGYQINIYSALKKFSEYMYVSKKAPENYMQSIKRPRFFETQKTIDKREKGYLTEEEIKKVLSQFNDCKTWKDYRDHAVILLMLNTGMRRTALTRINISDYSKEDKSITVTDKGSKVRKFILNNNMCNVLDQWLDVRMTLEVANKDSNAMFLTEYPTTTVDYVKGISNTTWTKERASSETIYGIVKKYTKCVDGKKISPHKLRATYGTQLYNKTHDIYFVQNCMGHNSPTTTEKYVRGEENKTKDASELLESLYS